MQFYYRMEIGFGECLNATSAVIQLSIFEFLMRYLIYSHIPLSIVVSLCLGEFIHFIFLFHLNKVNAFLYYFVSSRDYNWYFAVCHLINSCFPLMIVDALIDTCYAFLKDLYLALYCSFTHFFVERLLDL